MRSIVMRVLSIICVLCLICNAAQAELADDLLAKLRERGWHDTVLDYLNRAEDDAITTPAFLQKIGYERAVTRVAIARGTTSEKKRKSLLEEAAKDFEQFASEQPGSPVQLQALSTAGSLLTELALYASNSAEKLPDSEQGQRDALYDTARGYLDRAERPLKALLSASKSKLESLPKAAELQNNTPAVGNRAQLEGKQAEANFLLAKLEFETARTHKADSKDRKQGLKDAAKSFESLYNDYDDKLVGFYGRFYQGRSLQTAGDLDKALKCYLDIVDQPPIPNQDFRRLVSRSFRRRAECLFEQKKYEKIISECESWLGEARGGEPAQPDWLAVSYQLARAYEAQADTLDGGDAKRLRDQARRQYRSVAKNPGEFQREAKARMASSGAGRSNPQSVDSFEEAFAAGKDALEQMNSAKLAARLAKTNNPDSYESLNEQAESEQLAALQYFRQANQFANSQTDSDQLATARYYLCWLYWQSGSYEDAAVIGEFLSTRYPENDRARDAANLALAAYERLYNEAKKAGESTDIETQRLVQIAELMLLRWPESDEAAAGLNLLINIALRDNRLAEAEAMLEKLSPSKRASAELRLGSAFWSRYLRASGKNSDASAESVQQLRQKAGQLLTRGHQALEPKVGVTKADATGVLYYIQFLLSDGKPSQAVEVLENGSVGPLALIDGKSNAANRPGFVQEAYKVGLRAYVSADPPQREKAQAMMASLESAIGDEAGSEQKLINIYVGLGLQLQQQISDLTASGNAAQARTVAASFADLLARVTDRAGAADNWKVENWIAHTNLQLAQGLLGRDAEKYYKQAESTYQSLIEKAAKNPKFAPSEVAVLATKKKLADCFLAQGKFAEAVKQYAFILKSKPNMLELQQAAASALQQWGAAEKDTKRLEEAIRGAMPQANKKNLVWGWLRLATIADQAKRRAEKKAGGQPDTTGRIAKYNDLFFEARYQAAKARLDAARLANGAKQQDQMRKARQSLESMQRLYPKLGGPKWQQKYQQLQTQMEQQK